MTRKITVALFTCLFFILGLAISMQYRSQQAIHSDLTYQSEDDLLTILDEMNKNRSLLGQQWMESQTTLEKLKDASVSESALREQMVNTNLDYTVILGDRETTGPGIRITFENTEHLMGTDLVDLLNELWTTGAEAIAVNGTRIDGKSSFSTTQKNDKTAIVLNGKSLETPITVEAIGNSEDLAAGIRFPGGILEQIQHQYGLTPVIDEVETLSLPAAS